MSNVQQWIGALIDNLEDVVPEEKRVALLEEIGRKCIPGDFIRQIEPLVEREEDAQKFLENMCRNWEHIRRDGDTIYVEYPECTCPVVKERTGEIPPAFCTCCQGWIKELFETVVKKPVTVRLDSSRLRGDDMCTVIVTL